MSLPLVSAGPGVQLFGRAYTLIAQGATDSAQWGNEGAARTPLRVQFEVTRELVAPNKATIKVYNLSPESRLRLVKYAPVRLRAGYQGLVGVLFTGLVAKSNSDREGSDIVTQIEAVDSEPFAHYSVLDKSYEAGTPLSAVLQDCAAAMYTDYITGDVRAVGHGAVIGLPEKTYPNGLVVHGPINQTLTKLCRPLGLEWSVQNGALTVIPRGHYDGRAAQVISAETGLIGVPGDSGDCKTFSALLNPRLVPGGLVQLKSINQKLSGYYKLRKAVYQGDSHDQTWQVNVEAVAYDGRVTPLPSVTANYSRLPVGGVS